MFRQTIPTVILTATLGFFILTTIFGLFIWKAGFRHPECVVVMDGHYDPMHFTDAYMLSWTTFTTVVRSTISIASTPGLIYFSF
jgi:hypothetical protein